jgi:SAM-dependent methyltransferase
MGTSPTTEAPEDAASPSAITMDRILLWLAHRSLATADKCGLKLGKRAGPPTGHPYRDIDPRQMWARRYLSWRYIRGEGIEIGALHCPLPLYGGAKSKYVDYIPLAEIRKHYPELEGFEIAEPDIIDNAELLTKVQNGSQDFIVANHFIEHCENPLGTLQNLLSKLRDGGRIFMAVPMRDATFDHLRALTPASHILNDYLNGHEQSRWEHYIDWAKNVAHGNSGSVETVAKELLDRRYSIHFHVWNFASFHQLLELASKQLNLPFKVLSAARWGFNPFESVYILEKLPR